MVSLSITSSAQHLSVHSDASIRKLEFELFSSKLGDARAILVAGRALDSTCIEKWTQSLSSHRCENRSTVPNTQNLPLNRMLYYYKKTIRYPDGTIRRTRARHGKHRSLFRFRAMQNHKPKTYRLMSSKRVAVKPKSLEISSKSWDYSMDKPLLDQYLRGVRPNALSDLCLGTRSAQHGTPTIFNSTLSPMSHSHRRFRYLLLSILIMGTFLSTAQ